MELTAVNFEGSVLDAKYNEPLVHQVVNAYRAAKRQGSKAQKSRSQVKGGGAKPWRQKGTGRARSGTNNSPIWRSGGVTFAATPRNYEQKINKKMYKGAMRAILSQLAKDGRLMRIDELKLEQPKTKVLADKLATAGLSNALIVAQEMDDNLYLSARNLKNIGVTDISGVNPLSLLSFKSILMTTAVIKELEERLS